MFHSIFLPIKALTKPIQTLAAVKTPTVKDEANIDGIRFIFFSLERAVVMASIKPEVAIKNFEVSIVNLYQSIGAGGVEKKNIILDMKYGMKKNDVK